jgi:hypothetical protein
MLGPNAWEEYCLPTLDQLAAKICKQVTHYAQANGVSVKASYDYYREVWATAPQVWVEVSRRLGL